MYLRLYLSEKLFEESANEDGDFVSIQQVKASFRVSVEVNYSVTITVKGAATFPSVSLDAFTESRGGSGGYGGLKQHPSA